MDKLEAVRLAAIRLDQAMDHEFKAEKAHRIAKDRLIEADKHYAAALDALHEARPSSNDDDAQAQASLEGTG
jgi:hypothetical protein